MPIIIYIIIFNFLGSIISLCGGVLLLFKQKLALKVSHFISAYAAGALLATAFFDLLPESLEEAEKTGVNIFLWTLLGFLFFFLLERFIHWFHGHSHNHEQDAKPTVPLIVLGDSIHNFIDGVAITTTFMASIPLGIVTSIAVGLHEIPQEIGDFGLLLHKGVKPKKVFLVNFTSALVSFAGALLTFLAGATINGIFPIFLAITAGFFIYIAAADLIPEIHHENRKGFAVYETLLLIAGVVTFWLSLYLLSFAGLRV